MATVIKLSGSLAKQFGREHVRHLETGTVQEAVQALKHTLDGFEAAIKALASRGVEFVLFKNRRNIHVEDMTERGAKEIRIVPRIDGSKSGGLFTTILGAVLIVASFIPGLQVLMPVGLALLAGGVIQMLSPQPKTPKPSEQEGNDPSYGFGGAVTTTASGHPVPLLLGERLIGGALISGSIIAEDYR